MLCNGSRPVLVKGLPHHLRFQSSATFPSSSSSLWKTTLKKPEGRHPPERVGAWPVIQNKGAKVKGKTPIAGQEWKHVSEEQRKDRPAKPWTSKKTVVRPDWKQDIRSNKAQEKCVRDAIQTVPRAPIQSQEKQAYFGDGSQSLDSEEGLGEIDVPMGSFVATRRNDIESLGIVLGNHYQSTRRHLLMLCVSGETWLPFPSDVTFVLPSCVPPTLAERCGRGEIPVGEGELIARMEVLKRTREIVRELEAKYNSMGRFGSELYPKVKSSDPTAWTEVKVAEVARMVESNPRFPTIYATHRHLMNNSLYFVSRDPYLITQIFDVRPQNEVDEISKVLDWKRKDDPRLRSFVDKAKLIIEQNADRLRESAWEPPSETPAPPVWNSDDKIIISFLVNSIRQTRSNQKDPYMIAQTAILRLLDPSIPRLEGKDLLKLLVNIGIFAPWQDITAIQKHLDVEAEDNANSPRIARQEQIVQRSLVSRPIIPSAPLGPDDFYPSDPLEVVRHDFGQLPVFVVDSGDAKELDDGISIERIPSEPGSYWVHAHISNPTATLPPTHALAIDAMKRAAAQYFGHHSIPLLPKSLMYHPEIGWSLGSQEGKPNRVMTFSGKLSRTGELIDYKVRAGIVNNVRVLSYDAVNKLIGQDRESLSLITRPFGGPTELTTPADELAAVSSLPDWEKEDLHLLYKISKVLQQHWLDRHPARLAQWTCSVGLGDFPAGTMTPTLQYRQFQGFPEFTKYTVFPSYYAEVGAFGMVGEIMKIAGRVGSKFAVDHNLPLIRRVAEAPLYRSLKDQEAIVAKRGTMGHIFPYHASAHIAGLYGASYSMEPRAHHYVGAEEGEGYARTTSPLRRALDLVSHWQFHRALLGKHADSSTPMFDADWMDEFRVSFGVVEKARARASQFHELYWQAMFIEKWTKGELRGDRFIPPDIDAVYEGYLTNEGVRSNKGKVMYGVNVPTLGISGQMEGLPPGYDSNTKVMLRLKGVQIGVKSSFDFELAALG